MRNVLIVDDDRNNRLAIKLNIHKHPDLKIFEAENGQEAVDIAASMHMDLVFMDIMMPVMDGIEATKIIKKSSPHSMVVAISAMDDDHHKSLMLQAGAEDYITKPFHPDILKKRLANYLRLIVNRCALQAHSKPMNGFEEPVYDRRVVFSISQEASLALLWEEYLFSDKYSGFVLLSDAVRTLYDVSLVLLQEKHPFMIICEENDHGLFFTLKHHDSLEERSDVLSIVNREFANGEWVFHEGSFSIKIPCVPTPLASVCEPNICESQPSQAEVPVSGECQKPAEAQMVGVRRSEKPKISAVEYIRGLEEDFADKCEEFEKVYEVLDGLVFDIDRSQNYELLRTFGDEVIVFSQHVDGLFEFHQLAESIYSLGDILQKIDLAQMDDHLKKLLVGFISSFLSDLDKWIKDIFIDNTATDIHYLDNSLTSSFIQIESLLGGSQSNGGEESDLELF